MAFFNRLDLSLRLPQILFTAFGIWSPPHLNVVAGRLYLVYSFVSIFSTIGVYIIIQTGDLVQVWGKLPLMAASMFLLFTNLALGIKVLYVMVRRKIIQDMISVSDAELSGEKSTLGQAIIKSYHKETTRLVIVYCTAVFASVFGLTSSAEKGQLPVPACIGNEWLLTTQFLFQRYPYDTSKTPAYQWTYAHQIIALNIAAAVNVGCDTLVTSLTAQCRCRLKLVALSLRTLCDDLDIDSKGRITPQGERVVLSRLRCCVQRHQLVLGQVKVLHHCFSVPVLAQFAVAAFILCVSAYQMAYETSLYRLTSMAAYIVAIMLEVFFYCYEGNKLVTDIIKASYTFFTVLQSTLED